MRAQEFSAWLSAIAGMSVEQRRQALQALTKADGEAGASEAGTASGKSGKRGRREDALERRASSGWKAGAARIAPAARSSAGAVRTGCCGSAARVADARSTP